MAEHLDSVGPFQRLISIADEAVALAGAREGKDGGIAADSDGVDSLSHLLSSLSLIP